ncbi:MAG: sodium-dependent transporter [Oscillospiraceae bacterium]
MKREKFGSRLGFILVSAGCAIGLGNVWKFPYICAKYGGGAFIVIYLIFLAILGYPILIAEFAVGRGSSKSLVKAYDTLGSEKSRFHRSKFFSLSGNYLLMMFYTMICGWMMNYAVKMMTGKLDGLDSDGISLAFQNMLSNTGEMIIFTILAIVIAFGICALGLNNGVEKVTKVIMILLLILLVVMAGHSLTLENAAEGIKYYLVPDINNLTKYGLGRTIFEAMSHAFFTLSVGIGSMEIFGSYLNNDRKLTNEAFSITLIDTFIALTAGFIIIPACISFNVPLDSGPSLLFISLPNVFNNMNGGRIWGSCFFIFMTFAALSTVIAVFENILAMCMEQWNISRKKAVMINIPLMTVLSMPAVLGFNVLSGINPLGDGTNFLDLEDFLVSNNILPLGSMVVILFCTHKHGWGWDNFTAEVNKGKGHSLGNWARPYMTWVLPVIVAVVYLKGYYDFFAGKGTATMIVWMIISVILLGVMIYFALPKKTKENENNK